jgi:uncharacterized protein YqgV (UPF0045/DUF77 family)
MSELAAQISLYPLAQDDLSLVIDEVLAILDGYDLRMEVGAMSTLLYGPDDVLFAALLEATRAACRSGRMVMVATISNACAVPDRA